MTIRARAEVSIVVFGSQVALAAYMSGHAAGGEERAAGAAMAFSTPSTKVNGAVSACSQSVGGLWVTTNHDHRREAAVKVFALSGGSANAIAFPSGSGAFTWRTPFE
jgi:hypothetical protein